VGEVVVVAVAVAVKVQVNVNETYRSSWSSKTSA
jgi:hypothetical protein